MACGVCGAEECDDPMHKLPRELFEKILTMGPLNPSIPAVAKRWRDTIAPHYRSRFISVPEGTLQAVWHPDLRRLWCPFTVTALFMPKAGVAKNPGEYRQRVRGHFRRNGKDVAHQLPGGKVLSPTEWQIDGPAGTNQFYGQRQGGLGRSNAYGPELKNITLSPNFNGSYFQCSDSPYITGATGDVLEMSLEFEGSLVDFDARTRALRYWKVEGRIVVPAEEPKASPGLVKKK